MRLPHAETARRCTITIADCGSGRVAVLPLRNWVQMRVIMT
jgi:hypothetical protein